MKKEKNEKKLLKEKPEQKETKKPLFTLQIFHSLNNYNLRWIRCIPHCGK